ncbi:MAG: TolC family protein [Sulfuricurvum sp.]|nr:TolC family protein [Sulfuricurvum sp.]MDD5386323.1 TolC family protein [Sulfuricurvum sp.]
MRLFLQIIAVVLIPVSSYAMSFNEVCDHAYNASSEIITTNGHIISNAHSKASALAGEPLSLEGDASSVKGKDSINSGMRYGTMLNFHLKRFAAQEAQADQYDQTTKMFHQEVQLQQRLIQVILKRDWLIATIEQEKIKILREKVASTSEACMIGQKKVAAGRMSQMELYRLQSDERNAAQELAMGKMEFEHAQHSLQESAMLHEEIVIDDLNFAFIADDNTTEEKINNAALLQVLTSQINALDARIKSARYEGKDFLSMGAGATHEPTQNSIDFRISIPLVWSEKNDQKIAALMAEKSALLHRRDVTHQKLQMNIHTLLEHLETREKRFKESVNAQKYQKILTEMAQKGYEGGVVTQFEYLATKNSYYDARLRAVELKRDYIQEMSALEEKLGRIW